MIEVKNLVKRYGNHTAVNGISFTVEKGKIYGFLGPNGAGKSTTMNILTGCLAASGGSVSIGGFDIFESPKEAKKQIGYLPEIPPVYGDMTPYEYLTFVAEAKKVKSGYIRTKVNEVMEETDITDVSDRLIKNLSKGYRQRVGIAQAMLGDPDIIILDEPTVGLDPKQILEIRRLIKRLGENKTVILSSHILAEISAVCERVMVISNGNLVANDTLEHLHELANRFNRLSICFRGNEEKIFERLFAIEDVLSMTKTEEDSEGGSVTFDIECAKDKDLRDEIFFAAAEIGSPILSMKYEQMTLEDIYLALTDDSIRPNSDGNMPSIEDILSGKYKEELQSEDVGFEHMTNEELEALTCEGEADGDSEPVDESAASPDEADSDIENGESDTDEAASGEKDEDESADDGEYKPLFGGK